MLREFPEHLSFHPLMYGAAGIVRKSVRRHGGGADEGTCESPAALGHAAA
jgi:hypothetical protein